MNGILITNNPAAEKKYFGSMKTIYLENTDYIHILYSVRDKIHEGHKLLTHPLSGSVKPNQTPYKSIVISEEKGQLDFDSLKIIEDSITIAKKLLDEKPTREYSQKILDDFQLIDLDLITGGIESMRQF